MGIWKSEKTVKIPKALSQLRRRLSKIDRSTTPPTLRQDSTRVGLRLPIEVSTHSVAVKRAPTQRDLDRFQAENIELDAECSRLFGDMMYVDNEYDALVQQLEKLEAPEVKILRGQNKGKQYQSPSTLNQGWPVRTQNPQAFGESDRHPGNPSQTGLTLVTGPRRAPPASLRLPPLLPQPMAPQNRVPGLLLS